IETYSPAAMEKAPASRPATPATTTNRASAAAPATPMISERFDTRPSFTPKIAARSAPLLPPAPNGSSEPVGPGCGRIMGWCRVTEPRGDPLDQALLGHGTLFYPRGTRRTRR